MSQPPSTEYVIDALDRAQRAFEASVDPDTPKAKQRDAVWSYIHHSSVAVLAQALIERAPDLAALAIEWLESAVEDDTAAQWVYEARLAVAEGRQIQLPWAEGTK